jgi:predicted Zn-dependent protease
LVQEIGTGQGIDWESMQTVQGLTAVRMELARQAQKRGDVKEAKTQVDLVVKVDPQNPEGVALKSAVDKSLKEMEGRIPSDPALEQASLARKDKIEAATMVQDGRILLEAGKLDDAEAKLKAAIKQDPSNHAAFYYLSLVKERRHAIAEGKREQNSKSAIVEVGAAWSGRYRATRCPSQSVSQYEPDLHEQGRQAIVSKLDRIRMDNVQYTGLGLGEVVRP